MRFPSDDLRGTVQRRCEELRSRPADSFFVDAALEDGLDSILDEISEALAGALELDRDEGPGEALSRVEAWVSLASYAAVRTYGPESPWWRGWAGWRASVARRLRRICDQLNSELARAAGGLHADGWSIGASFPAGITVALSWSTSGVIAPHPPQDAGTAIADLGDSLDAGREALERLKRAIPKQEM